MQRISITLLQYAGYLLILGLASVFYNAADRSIGWNPKGVSGLIALGSSAAVAALLGFFAGKGKEWAGWGGVILSFALLSYCGMTAFKTARGVSSGELDGHLWYKAALFGITVIFSISAFLRVGVIMRRGKTA